MLSRFGIEPRGPWVIQGQLESEAPAARGRGRSLFHVACSAEPVPADLH